MKKIGFLHEYEGGVFSELDLLEMSTRRSTLTTLAAIHYHAWVAYFQSWSDFIIIIMAVICLKLVMKY